jgi:methylated-DNA-[protein]-cysteine S-methyltransferase
VAAELRSSARAVGGACGANPIPVVVPCHRIIGANHAIGGFMGTRTEGFELGIKRWLLEHEGAI